MNAHWKEFEKEGEASVRRKLLMEEYKGDQRKEAVAYIYHIDHQRSLERERRASLDIRNANRAAWTAAIAAIIAAVSAIWPHISCK